MIEAQYLEDDAKKDDKRQSRIWIADEKNRRKIERKRMILRKCLHLSNYFIPSLFIMFQISFWLVGLCYKQM